MSDVLDLLAQLRRLKVKLELHEGKLKINAPKGALDDDLKLQLTENKEALIHFLLQAGIEENVDLVKAPEQLKRDLIPATDSQARFWFLDQLFPGEASFNIPALLEIRGDLNIDIFEQSIQLLLQRHESLRLCFHEQEGKPILHIPEQVEWKLTVHKKSVASSDKLKNIFSELSQSALSQGFDLEQGPLIRIELFELEKQYQDQDQRAHYVLLCCVHHIVCDAWSIGLILKDIGSLYLGLLQGNAKPSTELEFNFSDYAYWLSLPEQAQKNSQHLEFWKQQLKDAKGLLKFPYDKVRPLKPTSEGRSLDFRFDQQETESIHALCKKYELTPFMFFMAAYQLCLSLYCRVEDVCVGIPVAGRTMQATENIVGLFLNALVIRSQPQKSLTIEQYLKQIRHDILQAFDHQLVGIDSVIDYLGIDRVHDEVPGVQFGFNFQNTQKESSITKFETNELSLRPVSLDSQTSKHDIALTMGEFSKQFFASVEYRSSILNHESIEQFIEHFKRVCFQLIKADQTTCLSEITLLSNSDIASLIGVDQHYRENKIQEIRKLTLSQQGFYFNDLIRADNQSTLIGTSILVEGDFNLEKWKQSLQSLSDQRAVLRMQIFPCEAKLAEAAYQVIFKNTSIDFEIIDATQLTLEEAQAKTKALIYSPFELHRRNLIRYRVFCLSEQKYLLVTSMHHTLMDAISALQHWVEAQALYEDKAIAEDNYLSYLDFAEQALDTLEVKNHWQHELAGVETLDYTVYGQQHQSVFHPQGRRISKRLLIQGEQWNKIKHYCRKQGVTPAILYKVVFARLLSVWCQAQDDFYINEIITGRPSDFSYTLGNCFLIQPFIFSSAQFEGEQSVIHSFELAKAQQKRNKSFARLTQQAFSEIKSKSRIAFFYNFLNFVPPEDFLGNSVEFRDWGNEIDDALEFNPRLGPNGLELNLFYREALFSELNFLELLQSLVDDLVNGLSNFEAFEFTALKQAVDFSTLSYLSAPMNKKQAGLQIKAETVVDLFLQHAADTPQAPAILGEQNISYAELEKHSARIANWLTQNSVALSDVVVLELEKSADLIAALLGVLRVGAQYLPLDVSLPEERKTFIKQNSTAKLILDSEKLLESKNYPDSFDALKLCLNSPAYTIYTSGSTGVPKGVQVGHGALVRRYLSWEESFALTTQDRHLQMASVGFDVFTGDWVRCLCSGASMYLVDKFTLMDAKALGNIIETFQISIAEFVPAVLRNLCVEYREYNKHLSLRMLMVGSDAWFESDQALLEKICAPETVLINSYGVTEACIDSSYSVLERSGKDGMKPIVSIGQPLANTALYVLDKHQHLLPRAVSGELYIAGSELADGYVNDDEKTRHSFLPNSVEDRQEHHPRMYRTGDKAVLTTSGELILLGRIGQQVKIRGFRVELGEIENKISAMKEVEECVVLAQSTATDQTEKILVAYVVLNQGNTLSQTELRQYLARQLPDYMLPQVMMVLDEIPLNANGKLDRNSLPEIDFEQSRTHAFVEARNELEAKLVEIWQQVLALEKIGVHDNFFELGGHSLLATQVISRVSKTFQRNIALKVIFEHATVEQLAEYLQTELKKSEQLSAPEIIRVDRKELMPVTYAQRRFWFLDRLVPGFFAYNMPFGIRIRGTFDEAIFQRVMDEILQRHELLRCNFISKDDKVFARVAHYSHFPLQVDDFSESSDKAFQLKQAVEHNAHKAFSLESELLLRCRLIKLAKNETILLGCIHHIIADGWSIRILFKEIALLYNAYHEGRASPLIDLKLQYLDYAAWEQNWMSGAVLEQYTNYWLKALHGAPEILKLPTDKPRPLVQTFNGKQIFRNLSAEFLKQLQKFSSEQQISLFMLLLSAMSILMSRYSGEKDILIGTPVAGRNQLASENIIGLFLNAVIIRSRLHNNPSVKELLEQVKENSLGAFAHQDMPTEILFEKVAKHRNPQYPAGAQVGLVLQNTASQTTQIDARQFGEQLQGLSAELIGTEQVISNYDFGFTVVELESGLQVIAEFNTDLFFDSTIEIMLEQYIYLLEQMIAKPDAAIESLQLVQTDQLAAVLGVDTAIFEDVLPLSAMQHTMYLANKINPRSREYGVGFSVRIRQTLDVELWTQCLQGLIDTQSVTRVVFAENAVPYLDDVYQYVLRKREAKVEWVDWSGQQKREQDIEALASQFINAPYNLLHDEAMRVMLIKLSDEYFVGVFGAHHVLMDGIAVVAFGVMGALNYELISKGGQAIVHPDQYKAYQRQSRIEMDRGEVQLFWKQMLQEKTLEALEYPVKTDVLRDMQKPAEKSKKSLTLESEHWEAIKLFCKQNRITPALYFKALYAVILGRYCRVEENFYLFEILSGRPPNQMNALGCYFQQIPIVIDKEFFSAEANITELFKFLRQQQKQTKAYQLISVPAQLAMLPEAPVSFMYNFEHYIPDFYFMGNPVEIQEYSNQVNGIVQLLVKSLVNSVQLNLQSQHGFFEDFDMLERIEALSKQIISGSYQISYLNLLSEQETRQQLQQWNKSSDYQASTLCVHHLIEQAAEKFPNHCALKDGRGSINYRELNEQANQLARYLREQGIGSGDVVGICLPLCKEVSLALLAILKTGAAYLPMDSRYPDERLKYFLETSKPKLVLTNPVLLSRLETLTSDCEFYSVYDSAHSALANNNLDLQTSSQNLIYVLYTSGSTGQPNCTASFHHCEVNLIDWYCNEFSMNEADNVLVISALGFDLTQKNLMAPLTCGASIVFYDYEHFDDKTIVKLICSEKISWMNCAPSAFYPLCADKNNYAELESLRWIFLGGEALAYERLSHWYEQSQSYLVNSYGPSECTDISSYYILDKQKQYAHIPLGQANSNVMLYVMDRHQQLLPAGLPGELYVGGAGVGAGYLNNQALTQQKFLQNPFAQGRIYKTGDLVEYLKDGNLLYIGRTDFQIKRRGIRIEPAEIETRVKQVEGVDDCLVLQNEAEELIAYVLSSRFSEQSILLTEIIDQYLRAHLSASMLPDFVVVLDVFPLSPNGKVDRKALPAPDIRAREFVTPNTETEIKLAAIWQGMLNQASISRYDNFFEIGGHSLLAVQLISAINQTFNTELALATLFEAQTLDALAIKIDSVNQDTWQHWVNIKNFERPKAYMVCIHPVGGEVLCYRDFARWLPEDVAVSAIQAQGLLKEQNPLQHAEQLLEVYSELIFSKLSGGSDLCEIYLAGQSIGGVFALALGERLKRRGMHISGVCLFDSFTPSSEHLEMIGISHLQAALGAFVQVKSEELVSVSELEQLQILFEKARAAYLIPQEIEFSQISSRYLLVKANIQIASEVQLPLAYDFPVLHIEAESSLSGKQSHLAWEENVTSDISFEVASGNHESMMTGMNAKLLAEYFIKTRHEWSRK